VEHWKIFTKALCFGARPEATEARKQKLWAEAESFINLHADEPVDGWDGDYCLCDCFDDYFDRYLRHIWRDDDGWYKDNPRYFANHLHIAIRAGIDIVTEQPGGVLGFTVGDLRRMFNGGIPEWIACQFIGDLAGASGDAGIWL
jgi:hypothetical protein